MSAAPEDEKADLLTDAERALISEKSPGNEETDGWEYALLHRTIERIVRDRMAQAWGEGYEASDHEAYHFSTHGRTDNPYRVIPPGSTDATR